MRGTCRVCGRRYALTRAGAVRYHRDASGHLGCNGAQGLPMPMPPSWVRALAEETAEGWLNDGATGNAPGLSLADYIEVAIDRAIGTYRS